MISTGQRENTVYTVYAFLRAFSGVLLTLVGLILFLKRFLGCSVSQLTSGLRRKPKPAANPPEVSVQVSSDWRPYYFCGCGRSMNRRCCECTNYNYWHTIFHNNTKQMGHILYIHLISVSNFRIPKHTIQSVIVLTLHV